MKVSDINWTRGFTRIYILLVVFWFLYWIIWVPLEGVRGWQQLAMITDDATEKEEYIAHANLVEQWRELSREMVESPFATIMVILLPPILGYGVLRLLLAIIKWIVHGFKPADASQRS